MPTGESVDVISHSCMLSHLVTSNSLWSPRLYPARLLCPWDSPGKNTGVRMSCHFILQGIFLTQGSNPPLLHWQVILYCWTTWKAPFYYWSVAKLCPTLWDPMDWRMPGSSVQGILQARILEWVASPFSRASSWSRDRTWGSCIAGRFITVWASREALMMLLISYYYSNYLHS